MIEFRLWRSFVVLAEELSFRRAAARLNISQPALTKQIQELETRLGVALFRRETRGVEATKETLACLDAVRALLEQAETVEAQFGASRQMAEAKITFGMLEFFSRTTLPGIFQEVRNAYPEVRISIVEMNTFETAAAAADGRIDLGVARAPVSEQSVIARPYRRGHWILIMPDTHKLSEKTEVTLSDFGDDPLIFFLRRLNPELFDGVIAALEAGGKKIEIAYQAQDPMIGVELALSGIGLCLAVSYAVGDLPDGLVSRPVAGLDFEPMLDLVWRRDRMTPPLRMLIDAMLESG